MLVVEISDTINHRCNLFWMYLTWTVSNRFRHHFVINIQELPTKSLLPNFKLNYQDMRKNAGVAQILLPGFDLQDISLPKDSAKKEAMLKMYSDAMKTALAGITSIDEIDIDDEDDPTFTDDIMEKIERGEIDLEEYLAQVLSSSGSINRHANDSDSKYIFSRV